MRDHLPGCPGSNPREPVDVTLCGKMDFLDVIILDQRDNQRALNVLTSVPVRGGGGFAFVCLFVCFVFFMAAPKAHGGSQARGRIGAVADGLHHSHSNTGSLAH